MGSSSPASLSAAGEESQSLGAPSRLTTFVPGEEEVRRSGRKRAATDESSSPTTSSVSLEGATRLSFTSAVSSHVWHIFPLSLPGHVDQAQHLGKNVACPSSCSRGERTSPLCSENAESPLGLLPPPPPAATIQLFLLPEAGFTLQPLGPDSLRPLAWHSSQV